MSTSACNFASTTHYLVEDRQTGLPNSMELFGPGFTWQHATHSGESFFNTDGQWRDPEKQRECSLLAEATNAESVWTLAPHTINNHEPEKGYQPQVNHLVGQVAVLFGAGTELSRLRPNDTQLSDLNKEIVGAYNIYRNTIYGNEKPCTDLETNVDTLMDKITALATIMAETGTALSQIQVDPVNDQLSLFETPDQDQSEVEPRSDSSLLPVSLSDNVKAGPLGGLTSGSALSSGSSPPARSGSLRKLLSLVSRTNGQAHRR